ncbi:TIGR03750 family conjugal transfer protein [Pectobacterium carotovorum]|uniref:Membrane protein n=1 Tax=Pectobacterium carotovorum subsp. carotovorum TaxID=555 RepID=A0AAI9KZD4_PECCC|nr:TIGR03750 family conjugal transfer protein [Pectobacterium carotovorum]KHT26714.1 membrane protein [Pectobacterium carotovorum subsp. carotovorum]GKV90443.1 membrane protein [Pectobacterium carotovorum subsp. carotovorum]GKX46648.1 membrane protein [Pectobacterium carotovorum subsp. carotovorum]GLV68580.1 membrane protein [Pectobacterium carotovorum subsp. carotovorum]
MRTIPFLPDRLNAEPVVFRGFTTPELGLAALFGAFVGVLWSLFLIPLTGWVIIPTGILLTPLLVIGLGGNWMARIKRGKPENYIWQKLGEKKRRIGVGDETLIIHSRCWSLRRHQAKGRS